MKPLFSRVRTRRNRATGERGGAVVEFAVLLPVLSMLLFGVLDYGLAFDTGRQVEDTLRSAARLGAGEGVRRDADHVVLRAIASQNSGSELTSSNAVISRVVIYRVPDGSVDGSVPADCWTQSILDECNSYDGAVLDNVLATDFDDPTCLGDLDEDWCPTARLVDALAGDNLGVAVRVSRNPIFGGDLGIDTIDRHVVFRLEVRGAA